MTAHRILVAGVPSSGKSTFIAALRHVLLSDETASLLVMSKLADDERHLNLLQDRWLSLRTFDRTRETSEAWTTLHVQGRNSDLEAELIVPDLRGELFERPAATGKCLRTVADALDDASGILLFTNAEKPNDEHLISDYADVCDAEDEEPSLYTEGQQNGDVGDIGRLRFQPDRMPEEAMIVELLQFANRRPRVLRKRRLGVVVSAWDAIIEGKDERTPEQWFTAERPMLAQFLRHNADAWDVRIYGVSAQGGRLPRDAAKLQALETASERVLMVGTNVTAHDPTAPIAWLIDSD